MLATLVRDVRFRIRFYLCLLDRFHLTLVCRQLAAEETCFAIPRQYLDPIDVRAAPPCGMLGKWLHLLEDFQSVGIVEDARVEFVRCEVYHRLTHPPAIATAGRSRPGRISIFFHRPYPVIDGRVLEQLVLEGNIFDRAGNYNWHLLVAHPHLDELEDIAHDATVHLLLKRAPAYAQYFVL
jgi:hypothetical protein